MFNKIYNSFLLNYKKIKTGTNLSINGRIHIQGHAKTFIIGDNCHIVSCKKYNPLGGAHSTWFAVGPEADVYIGSNVGISNSFFRIKEFIKIGNDVNIGGDCYFYDSDMHSIDFINRMQCPDLTVKTRGIVIKDGVWIGAHSIILKGVVIGERSVIGAGSVVTKSIPQDELWAGNPARFIRKINLETSYE